jgi:hypothetical protein
MSYWLIDVEKVEKSQGFHFFEKSKTDRADKNYFLSVH